MGIFESIKSAFSKGEDEAPPEKDQPRVAKDEPTAQPPADAAQTSESTNYIVQSGDTLFSIAERVYGNGSKYLQIFEANRHLLDSPDHILPGQELVIPALRE
jgi:nucleoid-associated protein YgaU